MCGNSFVEMYLDYSDENVISWLTQEPSVESEKANFSLLGSCGDGEFNFDEMLGIGPHGPAANFMSLEDDHASGGNILYDNVIVEDISSDEELDKM